LQKEVRTLLYLHGLADMDLPGVAERRVAAPAASLRVAPRPCRGVLRVGLAPGTDPCELQIHDPCGRLVKRSVVPSGSRQAVLDLRDLRPGVYYVSAAGAGTVPVVVVR
jgi:hypothetical protein